MYIDTEISSYNRLKIVAFLYFLFREVFGDDFGDGRTGGIDPFREAGGVFGRRRSMFEDPFENDSFFGGRSAMAFGGSFGGMMGPTSSSQWSR